MYTLAFSPPLLRGRLVRRYKRFFVDVRLRNGRLVVAHTPNTGSMLGCSMPGSVVFLSRVPRQSRRQLRYTLELAQSGAALVGVNTLLPNRLIAAAVAAGALPELADYSEVRREVAVGRSRLDLQLGPGPVPCFVEIKNVTLVQEGEARFPDAVTTRGRRHLLELAQLRQRGARAVICFVVQREDCERMSPADAIDAAYGETLRQVIARGVEALVYQVRPSPSGLQLWRRIPLRL